MKIFKSFVIALFVSITSCTLDKTDYEAEIDTVVTEHHEFEEAVSFNSGNYKISIEALNGTFYTGYNEIRLKIVDNQTHENEDVTDITFLPIKTNSDGSKASCPHRYALEYNSMGQYYSGYSVFTSESDPMENWELYIGFTANDQTHAVNKDIPVQEQSNKNLGMVAFTGNDGEEYVIALVSPQKPKIAENELVAGIYKYDPATDPAGPFPNPSQFSYSEVNGHTLLLDPRMPEPSMGNHSSPNNVDLTQQADSLYYGVVNYTMTGNWTLNFIMRDQNGQIIKGTEVPTDFTPGIDGAKSELYIDILF